MSRRWRLTVSRIASIVKWQSLGIPTPAFPGNSLFLRGIILPVTNWDLILPIILPIAIERIPPSFIQGSKCRSAKNLENLQELNSLEIN